MEKIAVESFGRQVPAYVEVYNALFSDIMAGVYPPGTRLPGEVELAAKYGTGRHSLRQALVILVEDGLVEKHKGSGNYICEKLPAMPKRPDTLENPVTSCAKQPLGPAEVDYNFGPPTEVAQQRLGITPSDLIAAVNCIYRAGGRVVARSFVQVPPAFIARQEVDLHSSKEIGFLAERAIYENAVSSHVFFRLVGAQGEVQQLMEAPEGTPLVYLEQVLFDSHGAAIARCKHYLLPPAFELHFWIG